MTTRPAGLRIPYERALNALNELTPAQNKIFSAALRDMRKQRDELKRQLDTEAKFLNSYIRHLHSMQAQRDEARAVLSEILALYPYLNCVCGRNQPRMPALLRVAAQKAVGER